MQCTLLLVCKCRTGLPIFQRLLALPRFHSASVLHSHDARRALRLACMEVSPTPICAGHIQAWSGRRLMSLLLQSSTAAEDRPHHFHLLHLCQQMFDSDSHVVHRTSTEIHTRYSPKPKDLRKNQRIQLSNATWTRLFGHFQVHHLQVGSVSVFGAAAIHFSPTLFMTRCEV